MPSAIIEVYRSRMGDAATRTGRLDFIDGVRGLASLMVVIHHTVESIVPGYSTWAHSNVDLGRVGIVAFFVVSGYVVGLTLTGQSARTFSVRRFWRLYPVYWLTTSVWIIVWLLVGNPMPAELSVWALVVNATMLQGAIGAWSILNPAWTLGIEVAFYSQSVVAKLARRLQWASWLGWLWLAAFAALALSNLWFGTSFSALVPLMLFTASLGFSLFRWDTERDRALWPLLGAAIVVVPFLGVALGHEPQPGVWPPAGFNASYLLGLALFAGFSAIRRAALPRQLLWLGAISYSLYLIHLTAIQLIGHTPLWELPLVGATVAIVLSLVLAGLLYRFVEQPSIRYGRHLTASPNAPARSRGPE